jgi:sulfur carrier protein
VRVIVNGEPQELDAGLTVAALIEKLQLNGRRIAVEIGREIVARESYAQRLIAEGDEIEIVHFVGGG